MELRVGTSGFAYREWHGQFYPEALPVKQRLRFYAERLSAVEINNTFYRMPKASVLESWAQAVPEDFRFSIKASRRITHMKRLRDVEEETAFLLGNLEVLGPRLGAVLFQLPPNLRADHERLERFLDLLPRDLPAVLEFRHDSWLEDDVSALLRTRGVALCGVESSDAAAPALDAEASFGYLRLRRDRYEPGELREWARRLGSVPWREGFVFFKHESAGPELAGELQALFGRTRMRSVGPQRAREGTGS